MFARRSSRPFLVQKWRGMVHAQSRKFPVSFDCRTRTSRVSHMQNLLTFEKSLDRTPKASTSLLQNLGFSCFQIHFSPDSQSTHSVATNFKSHPPIQANPAMNYSHDERFALSSDDDERDYSETAKVSTIKVSRSTRWSYALLHDWPLYLSSIDIDITSSL